MFGISPAFYNEMILYILMPTYISVKEDSIANLSI